jgi:hypothetical protein
MEIQQSPRLCIRCDQPADTEYGVFCKPCREKAERTSLPPGVVSSISRLPSCSDLPRLRP